MKYAVALFVLLSSSSKSGPLMNRAKSRFGYPMLLKNLPKQC